MVGASEISSCVESVLPAAWELMSCTLVGQKPVNASRYKPSNQLLVSFRSRNGYDDFNELLMT